MPDAEKAINAGDRDPERLSASLGLVVRRYAAQIRRRPALAVPALLLPGTGTVLVFYAPPLVIARLLAAFARGEQLSSRQLAPYVLTFAALWLAGEALWRAADYFVARTEIRAMQALYIEALDELLAKDLAFFHDNFAGSLTKRALGYAARFENVFDVVCLQVAANVIPVAFVVAVLWTYSPALVATLLTMLLATLALVSPLIRRRQRLVAVREVASNTLAGHVADSIANADENVRVNGVSDSVEVIEGDATVILPLLAPVRVVLANIISSVLRVMLPAIKSALGPDGQAILSGLLAEERATMLAALESGGWCVQREDTEDAWWSVQIASR